MTESVYIESSVISYLTARPSRDLVIAARQAITETWWHEQSTAFDLYISALVESEISQGDAAAVKRRLRAVEDIPSIAISPEAQRLAEDLLAQGAVPASSEEDALHIGIAAAAGVEYLLTWNFKHINNAQTRAAIIAVVEAHGYVCPMLCSPEELGGEL